MFSVQDQIGLRVTAQPGASGVAASTARVAVDEGNGGLPWYSPRNPLVWFGAILAVTFGLGSVAGSVRLGKAKVSAQIGK